MKIALYEPSGSGGIFHYTFELAQGLVTTSAHVFASPSAAMNYAS